MPQKSGKRRFGNRAERHILQRDRQRAVFFQRHQHARQAGLILMFDQVVPHLGWLHIGRSGEHTVECAKFLD